MTARRPLRPTVCNVLDYGARGDGVADDSAAINAAVSTVYAAGGGTVYFPPLTAYRMDSRLVLPNDGAASPNQPPMRLTGMGAGTVGAGVTPASAPKDSPSRSILDLRYNGAAASKIVSTGTGRLEIDHLTLTDYGSSALPFVLVTSTVLHAHDLLVLGNPSKEGLACDQDGFVLGGTADVGNTGAETDAFQGYGTVIERVIFDRIRRGVYGRTWANHLILSDLVWWIRCGGECAVEFAPATYGAVGNLLRGLLIEAPAYTYGVKMLSGCRDNVLSGCSIYDSGASAVALLRCESGADENLVFGGFVPAGVLVISDGSASHSNAAFRRSMTGEFTFANKLTMGEAVAADLNVNGTGNDQFNIPDSTPTTSAIIAVVGTAAHGMWRIQNFGVGTTSRALTGVDSGGTARINLIPASGQGLTLNDCHIKSSGTTGVKIGTESAEKIGFWGAAPVARPAAIADTSGASLAGVEAEVNKLKAMLRTIGLLAS